MHSLVPVMKSSLVATGNRTCRRGWLKDSFLFSLLWQLSDTPNEDHNEKMRTQIEGFSFDMHCNLRSLHDIVDIVTGYKLGNHFYSRVVFTDKAMDKRYRFWNCISSSAGGKGSHMLAHKLFENPNDPDKMAIVFETCSGIYGYARWDIAQLEIFSEEEFSDIAMREGLYEVEIA